VPDCRRVRSAQVAAATSILHDAAAIRCARRQNERGVTLIEALIVVALIAMIAAVSFPAVSAGLDTLRLRSTSDAMVSFLNVALDHADRRQQAVEVIISPRENLLLSRTADLGFSRTMDLPAQVRIVSVQPALPAILDSGEPRHFLLYPGGSVPGIGIEISTLQGRKRLVSVDPVTGSPRSEVVQ
jgi:prepilin-type N-terminal cleavage/methylation domain-containing protein